MNLTTIPAAVRETCSAVSESLFYAAAPASQWLTEVSKASWVAGAALATCGMQIISSTTTLLVTILSNSGAALYSLGTRVAAAVYPALASLAGACLASSGAIAFGLTCAIGGAFLALLVSNLAGSESSSARPASADGPLLAKEGNSGASSGAGAQ